ncbi:hypothetical protein H9Q72_009505 [Fusarium xylarioides]|uniref:Uncharacterized protein n=1 Tax=Fusarium xylarioides TaxID=221167 RepID=A0A9P7HM29_9HYPO|nr:hypothetical protein H9Q72_009505 [Fusarium xylarioides]
MEDLNEPARRLKDTDTVDTTKNADEMTEMEIAPPAHTASPTIDATTPDSSQVLERPTFDLAFFDDPATGSRHIHLVGFDGLPLNSNNAISLPVRPEPSSSVEEVNRKRPGMVLSGNMTLGEKQAMGFTLSAVDVTNIRGQDESDSQQHYPACGNCGSVRHLLAECLFAGHHGVVEGCAVHNNKDHNTDQCPEFINAGLSFKVRLLVTSRGRLPPLATGDAWYPLAAEWNAQNPDGLIQMYPWTTEFTKLVSTACPAIQEVFDDHRDHDKLPIDPATKDWSAVQSSFATSTIV